MRFPWGRIWIGLAILVAVVLAVSFALQLLDINLITTIFPVDPDDPAPYG